MKVLLVHDYGVLAGGAERITVDLRDGLRARGHDVRIFASTATPHPLPNEADHTCLGTNAWPQRLLQIANPWAVRSLRAVLADFRPDLVHVRMFLTQLSPRILPLLAGVPALLHVGNQQTICPLNSRVLPDGTPCSFRAGLACRRHGCISSLGVVRVVLQHRAWRRHRHVFRVIVANSRALATVLAENGVPVGAVIGNGTRPVPPRPPLQEPPTLAFAGRFVHHKGLDVLLRAMASVRRDVPQARLLIVGDGPDRAKIEALVRTLALGDVVTLREHLPRPALDTALGTAWAQIAPSRYPEPGSNVVREAMMRGTAVVATASGGTPEIVRDGDTGFLIPPEDPATLARRLVDLVRDRALAERVGAAARAFALAELSTDGMVDRFEALYESMIDGRG